MRGLLTMDKTSIYFKEQGFVIPAPQNCQAKFLVLAQLESCVGQQINDLFQVPNMGRNCNV
jgi:hypothetical protein